MKIFVTGANGFVGQRLMAECQNRRIDAVGAVRSLDSRKPNSGLCVVGDLSSCDPGALVGAMTGCDVVVHLAARAHKVDRGETDPAVLYRQINVEGTRRVLEASQSLGIKKFIYLSSVKAAGEWNVPGQPLREDAACHPEDDYGRSKWEAEALVQQFCQAHGMAYGILRPPLVYGPGVKANFLRLMEAVAKGRWLPLGGVHNRRSLCFVGNLVDAALFLATRGEVASGTYYVADDEVVSTRELVNRMGEALGMGARLIPVPAAVLGALVTLVGRKDLKRKLLGDLEVDISRLKGQGWSPPYGLSGGLAATVRWYRGG